MSAAIDSKIDKVIHLRNLLSERFPGAHRNPSYSCSSSPSYSSSPSPFPARTPDHPLGLSLLDSLDHGSGLSPGTCVEIVSHRRGGGIGTLIGGLIQAAATGDPRYSVALIDGADSFDPASLSDSPSTASLLCQSLFWVRCRHRIDKAFEAADLLLRDGNLPLVMLDLQLCQPHEIRRGIPGGVSAWYRLRSLGEKTGTTLLAFTAASIVPGVPWRLELDHTWPMTAIDRLPGTNDLRQEPIQHTLTRSRSSNADETKPEKKGTGDPDHFAIAS